MRFVFISCCLIVGLLLPGVLLAVQPPTLESAIDYHREVCITPHYNGKSKKEVIAEMIARKTAEPFLARLVIGAPQNWRPLGDKKVPLEKRVEAAVTLVGTAISYGGRDDKLVAKAYSVMYFPVPKSEDCQLPKGLAEFVKKNNFWR